MNSLRNQRFLRLLVPTAVLLQMGGCTLTEVNELIQTIFLGITAAGAIAILQNI